MVPPRTRVKQFPVGTSVEDVLRHMRETFGVTGGDLEVTGTEGEVETEYLRTGVNYSFVDYIG